MAAPTKIRKSSTRPIAPDASAEAQGKTGQKLTRLAEGVLPQWNLYQSGRFISLQNNESPNNIPKPLSPSLNHITKAIEKSRKMLDWEDNWDDEGSVGYSVETWNRATHFLLTMTTRLWMLYGVHLEIPRILPGPDGSIDIHWKTEKHKLLINFPANSGESISFYGDNKSGQVVKGILDLNLNNQWLLIWLMQ